LRLAPFYDLMSTRVYSGLGSHFAFRIGGENEPGKLGSGHMRVLAAELKVAPRYLAKLADEVAEAVMTALPAAAKELEPLLSPSEQVMVERLQLKIRGMAGKMQARLAGKPAAADASDA
jgi:serine/threonine-protein kinase HipA